MITLQQARQFILLKHGLLGEHTFIGKQGALDFIRKAGCIQFDPVDLCGKNAEILLHARVKNFKKEDLHDLLYKDRLLFDYPDKQLSIIPVEYWPYFERTRNLARLNLQKHPDIEPHINTVRKLIQENGAICSDDFNIEGETKWWSAINWSAGSKISRSVLEQMYSSGDLIVHHKKGTRRYYDLTKRHIPAEILNEPDPLANDFDHLKWRVLRRIGAVGMLWNRSSDAWLMILGLSPELRNQIFDALLNENAIIEIIVEGVKNKLYIRSDDKKLLEKIITGDVFKPRCELISPLDPMMWDRKLIKTIFGFEYAWEIYTPAHKRKYGAYVLPLIYGDRFIGRVEAVRNRETSTLAVKNIWLEDKVRQTKKLEKMMDICFKRFAGFNGCKQLVIH